MARRFAVLVVLLLSMLFVGRSPAAAWSIDQVTYNTESDTDPYAAIVQNAFTMIAYDHGTGDSQEVWTGGNMPGDWVTFQVTDNNYRDAVTDITSKPSQMLIHFVIWWQAPPYQGIRYCKGNPSGWPIQLVTPDTGSASRPSLEIDKSGFAHIVYQKTVGDHQEIWYTSNATGAWVHEPVTVDTLDGWYPCLALDAAGNPEVIFVEGDRLCVVTKAAGIWSAPEPIATGIDSLTRPYFVLDGDGHVHLCFSKSDGSDEEIYYLTNAGGSWQETRVTDNNFDDLYPSIFVDPERTAHIAYVADEPTDAEIGYADNRTGTWVTELVTNNAVDDQVSPGRYFLADLMYRGHIFFWNDQDGDNEIYHARSRDPLYAGVEETAPVLTPPALTVSPIVAASATVVRFSVPGAGRTTLRVYDASGRLVRTLVDRTQAPGIHRVSWDGCCENGVRAAAGIYFFRLTVAGRTATAKAIRTRGAS